MNSLLSTVQCSANDVFEVVVTKQPFIDIDMVDILGHLYNMDGHKIEAEDIICKYIVIVSLKLMLIIKSFI